MWGQGSIMAHRRRDKSAVASAESTLDMSEDENLFDFIGRELDQREEEAMRLEQQQKQQQQKDNNGNGNINDNQTQVGNEGYSQSSDNEVVDFTTMNDDDCLSVADGINDSPDDERKHDASNDDNRVADKIPRTTSKRRREYSVVKSTTPRFSFQSTTKSAAATASNNKKSPMEVVQHSVTSPLTATQSENQPKSSKQRRMHRHSFRQSLDRNNTSKNNNSSSAMMTQVNNNMRELAFVPKFLANSRAAAGIANDAISSQLEGHDGNNNNNDAKRKWGPLSSTLTASPYKQSNSSSNSRRSKAGGYLIQNLRSLRNNDQRMAMRLRVSMGGGSSSALMSRKRRRSNAGAAGSGGGGAVGNNLDPKQVATSQLDVTVMGATDAGSTMSNIQNESSSIRLAYIHRYTTSAATVNNLTTPCYSWIVLPQSVINEQSVGEGDNIVGSSMLLQFRCYDVIVIPPRIAHVDAKGHSIPPSGLEEHERPLPTIICVNVCEKYTTNDTMPPLPDVSFDMFFK